MLDGKYINDKIKLYYDKLPVFPPLNHIALGVNRSFEDLPQCVAGINYPLDEPVTIAGKVIVLLSGRFPGLASQMQM